MFSFGSPVQCKVHVYDFEGETQGTPIGHTGNNNVDGTRKRLCPEDAGV